jgi:hypothetical protein
MTTKDSPIVIELHEDFDDSEDCELDNAHKYPNRDEDDYYESLIQQVLNQDDPKTFYNRQEFMDHFINDFDSRIQSCVIRIKDQNKYSIIPKFTIPTLNSFFEKPCELIFDFFIDTKGVLTLTMQAFRSQQEIRKFENQPVNRVTMDTLLDYLEHEFIPSYFLPAEYPYFPLGLTRNLFGYAFSFLDPTRYEIKKTDQGFDLIPYGQFKYLDHTIHFSFWRQTATDKLRHVYRDSEESLKEQMNVDSSFDLDSYFHRFKVVITGPIRDKKITDVLSIFDLSALEHYLEYLGKFLPKHIPKLSTDQKTFLNVLCKLYGEIKDVDLEMKNNLETLIEKAFGQKEYTIEEKQMAVQFYKQYKDWGYIWKRDI